MALSSGRSWCPLFEATYDRNTGKEIDPSRNCSSTSWHRQSGGSLQYALGADAPTIAGAFLEWLSAARKSRDAARQAERFARDIANRVVDGLVPVVKGDHSPDLDPEAVALARGETLDRHLDGKFLVARDLTPTG